MTTNCDKTLSPTGSVNSLNKATTSQLPTVIHCSRLQRNESMSKSTTTMVAGNLWTVICNNKN